MKSEPPNPQRLPDRIVAICMLSLVLGGCATTTSLPSPPPFERGTGDTLAMVVAAKGVQVYECRASTNAASGHEWVFVAPEAELFDGRGGKVGEHGPGPSWQADDGSRIVGAVQERRDAPISGAIPWLKLSARSVGPDGTFSKVEGVERVNTVGGVAPASGCTPTTTGRITRIAYSADYRLFTAK